MSGDVSKFHCDNILFSLYVFHGLIVFRVFTVTINVFIHGARFDRDHKCLSLVLFRTLTPVVITPQLYHVPLK